MDYVKLKARMDEAVNYKGRWLALYQDLYRYVIPDRDAFNVRFNYRDDGKPTTNQIWDTTALLAASERANDLHGLLLPQDRRWGKIILNPQKFSQQDMWARKPALDQINERIAWFIDQSNLARVVSSSNLDLVGGTAAIFVESISRDQPLYFRSIPAVALFLEYSNDDIVCNCWYFINMSGRQIIETFPKYKGKMYADLIAQPDHIMAVAYGQVKIPNKNKYHIYAVLADDDPTYPLWAVDRDYLQIITYRDRVRPGETDGRGVGLDLLPTIRDLNMTEMYSTKSLAFKALPPMFYDANSYFNPYSIRQWAGAMIARKRGEGQTVEAMQFPTSPDVEPKIIRKQNEVKTGFMVDPLGTIESPVRSATEVDARENRAQRTSVTDISRLINELPRQIYETSARILSGHGLLKVNVDGDGDAASLINNKYLNFEYVSPLYNLQNQSDLQAFVQWAQTAQQFYGPGAPVAISNVEAVNNFIVDKLGLPANLFKAGKDLNDIIKNLGEAAKNAALPTASTTAQQLPTLSRTGTAL